MQERGTLFAVLRVAAVGRSQHRREMGLAIDFSFVGLASQLTRGFSINSLLQSETWRPNINPKFVGFAKLTHSCHSTGSQCLKWRQRSANRGFDGGREVESGNTIDVDRLLAIAEVACLAPSLVLSVGFAVQSVIPKPQNVTWLSSSAPVNKFVNVYLTWQILPLLGALIIGVIIRTRQWQRLTAGGPKDRVNSDGSEFSLIQRIKKLEEDVGSSVTIIRVLSRQLEKLGVRFRVTRQTLRDPINETAALAQKTSEAIRVLELQEDVLQKELRGIQHILLAMQEQQQKQLELILALGKAARLQKGAAYSVESTKKPQNTEVTSRKEVSNMVNQKVNSKRQNRAEEDGLAQKKRSFPKIFAQQNGRIPDVHNYNGEAEGNLSGILEAQGTSQDISDYPVSNNQEKDDDLESCGKDKGSLEGSEL